MNKANNKKLVSLLLIFFMFVGVLSACDERVDPRDIEGKWKRVDGFEDLTGIPIPDDISFDYVFDFGDDGKLHNYAENGVLYGNPDAELDFRMIDKNFFFRAGPNDRLEIAKLAEDIGTTAAGVAYCEYDGNLLYLKGGKYSNQADKIFILKRILTDDDIPTEELIPIGN